jgi:CheY-like chemotaxis protein
MILLVDDDREARNALSEFLSVSGYAVRSARNGREALWLLADHRNRPNVIFLDLEMPLLNGWGFLAERDKDPDIADVPVVIMTGSSGVTARAKEAGAVAVLHKPVEPGTLLKVIEHFSSTI